jgi:hypothetical protein
VSPANLKQTLSTEDMTLKGACEQSSDADSQCFRAAEAYVRPTPIAAHGDITHYGFDLKNCTFSMALSAPSSTKEEAPTVVFLPAFHFPAASTSVEVSGGKWTISTEDEKSASLQILRWWHAEGDQTIAVKGARRQGVAGVDDGYLAQLRACTVM